MKDSAGNEVKCAMCGSLNVESFKIDELMAYGPENPGQIPVTIPLRQCLDCSFNFTDWETEAARDAAMLAYEKEHGIERPKDDIGDGKQCDGMTQENSKMEIVVEKDMLVYLNKESNGLVGANGHPFEVFNRDAEAFIEGGSPLVHTISGEYAGGKADLAGSLVKIKKIIYVVEERNG